MVIIHSPLHSVGASGKIGERLVFIQRDNKQTARFQRAQKDYLNEKRSSVRAKYSLGVESWNLLNEEQKQIWRDQAISLHMSGCNLFLKNYLSQTSSNNSFYGDHFFGDFFFGSQ
jgi:hypothetical protein